MCVCVCVSHPRLFTGRVSFGIAENEPDVFAELDGRLVLSLRQRVENGAEVHRRLDYLQVVLGEGRGKFGHFNYRFEKMRAQ